MPAKRDAKTIQVFFRVRPPNGTEKERGDKCDCIHYDPQDSTLVTLGESKTRYNFHGIFKSDSRQEDVFDKVAKNAVLDCFEGYIGLMFVYGQTGTGKTFTMSCQAPGLEGMFQRAMGLTFDKIKADKGGEYEVKVNFIQIYQEVIQDLLSGKFSETEKKGLAIREDPDHPGLVYCHPLKEIQIYGPGDDPELGKKKALDTFLQGDGNRSVSATKMNATSSRSHTVFTMKLQRRNRFDYDAPDGEQQEEFKGQLILVDLAGCERQKKTGVEGKGLGEANAINGSLLVLGKVIKALTDPKQHVPFRESKLTRLLQYPLSGKGRTTLVVTAGPSEFNQDETRSAIEFGQRAMTIKSHAQKHVEIDYKAAYLKLKAQMDAGADEGHAQALKECELRYEEQLEEKDERIKELEQEVERLRGGGAASPSPDGSPGTRRGSVPPEGDDSARADQYKEKYAQKKQECIDIRQSLDEAKAKLHKKREELAAQNKENTELHQQLTRLQQELDVSKSTQMELAHKMRRKMERLSEERMRADGQLAAIRRSDHLSAVGALTRDDFRSRDDASSDAGSDASGLNSPRMSPADQELSIGSASPRFDDPTMGPEERLQQVWEDKMRLGEKMRACLARIDELTAYNDKMKQAIRFQASQQAADGGDEDKVQLLQRLAKAEDKAEKYKAALLRIQTMEDIDDLSSPGTPRVEKDKKDKKDKKKDKKDKKETVDDDVSDDGGRAAKEKKEKKKDKKEKKES